MSGHSSKPPAALRKAKLDNLVPVPASQLPFKDHWQKLAKQLPYRDDADHPAARRHAPATSA